MLEVLSHDKIFRYNFFSLLFQKRVWGFCLIFAAMLDNTTVTLFHGICYKILSVFHNILHQKIFNFDWDCPDFAKKNWKSDILSL